MAGFEVVAMLVLFLPDASSFVTPQVVSMPVASLCVHVRGRAAYVVYECCVVVLRIDVA